MTAPTSITDYLTTDHRAIDAQLECAQKLAQKRDLAGAQAAFTSFIARLARHIHLEEQVVFPLFESRTGITGPAQVMRREHRLLEAHLHQASLALESGDTARFLAAAEPVFALLAEHNMKEERILYPKTDQALGDERHRLAAELAQA